ncbi:hypothetical protein LAZ67_2003324 [Cordylochernes scorpioides]|uniref:DUF5641 domain-containing protein n=1 Tax=Cordylochernes scorpioides TaxID=51811 RepID=A0ABY6K5L5_9ARAC|nr:hypothetical protein LAZ67_2003324 [Cordylochernes scorpioides]
MRPLKTSSDVRTFRELFDKLSVQIRSLEDWQDRGGSSKSPTVQDETLANLSTSPDVLLPTLRVTLEGNRSEKTARVLIDTGSQRSYSLHSTAMEMEYEQSGREFFRHSLFGGSSTDVVEHEVYTIHLSDINNSYRCEFEALGQPLICGSMPPVCPRSFLEGSEELDVSDLRRDRIEVLIGADIAGRLLTGDQRRISSGLVAIRTKLGWTVMGKIPPTESLQAEMEEHFAHTTTRDIEERYEVALPWVQDKERIPTNRDLAENQLNLDLIDNQTLYRKYQYIKRVREDLRERFRIEYFGFLRQETRRLKTTIPFKVGDMVLIGQESLKRLHWPLARIIQLYPGKDGLVRVAKQIWERWTGTKAGLFAEASSLHIPSAAAADDGYVARARRYIRAQLEASSVRAVIRPCQTSRGRFTFAAARPVAIGGLGLLDVGTQLQLACLKGVQVALRGDRNGFTWLVTSEAWIRPPPDGTRLQPRRLRLLRLRDRLVSTSQLLDLPIIDGCRFLRPPDLLAPARWIGAQVRDLGDPHIAHPTRSALSDAAALAAFCQRVVSENVQESFRETTLAGAVVLRGTATPVDWTSFRRCAFSGHEADVVLKLALHALPHPAHPASAGSFCPACGSVDRSLGHRYWSCQSIRLLVREAFNIIGRPPDLQAWIFGSGVEDDALTILWRIYRYFVQVGLGGEVKTTRAHIAEARTRQASSTQEQCVFIEHCPDFAPYQYLRAIDRMVRGAGQIIQLTRMNGHVLVGLADKNLAERLIEKGLQIEGTVLRTFPFRRQSEKITIGNLPFYVEDAVIINALSPFGHVTSIAPKQLKAGEYSYTDGRREAYILLHDGMKLEYANSYFKLGKYFNFDKTRCKNPLANLNNL